MPTATRARSTRRNARTPTKGRSSTPTSNTATTSRRRKTAATRQHAPAVGAGFPGWADLGSAGRKKGATKKVLAAKAKARHAHLLSRSLDAAPSRGFGAWVLVGCIAATLYVGHVFATQETLATLQQAESENLQLRLTHERLQGAYDRMTGPDQILDAAAALGLEEGVAYGPTIHLAD